MLKNPDFTETLQELDAGILVSKLSNALANTALGVLQHNKKGKVILTIDLDRIGESSQINVSHKIVYQQPTLRGKSMEEDTTVTPMHVNKHGHMSIAPDTQLDLFKTKTEEI